MIVQEHAQETTHDAPRKERGGHKVPKHAEVENQDLKESSEPHVNKAKNLDEASVPTRYAHGAIRTQTSDGHFVTSAAINRDNASRGIGTNPKDKQRKRQTTATTNINELQIQ